MTWETLKLEELCVSITDGDHQALPLAEKGIPFIVIADINRNNRIEFEKARYVPLEYYEKLDEKRKPKKGDVLLTVKGSFGIPVYVTDNNPFVFQRDIAILKCNEKINPRFLYYYMKNPEFYQYTDSIAIGAAQRAITLKALRNTEIKLPPITIQQGIVNRLSSYDDLIENNQKQIKLLEEAAQRLYKEWFVDLRFPGHETTPTVDGIPEGWTEEVLGGICILKKDTISAQKISGKTPYIGLEHMPRVDFCLSSWGNAEDVTSNKYVYAEDDIIFGKIRPYFHKIGFTLNNGVVSTDSFVIKAKNGLWGLLLMTVFDKAFVDYTYQTCKEGAKMPRADWNQMEKYPVLIPSENIRRSFEEFIWNITRRVKVLALQNHTLAEARDRLLPKLMDGEIEV